MSRVKKNIVANLIGRGWAAVIGIAFVPLYIQFIGIEAYGLLGLFATVQAVFSLLDLGLSSTMNREMARFSARDEREAARDARDLVRTLELTYWGLGAMIAGGVFALAPIIPRWVNASQVSTETIVQSVLVLGVLTALQWPLKLYEGGLQGLQQQVLGNALAIGFSTLRSLGAILVLWLVSPTLQAFLIWQGISYGLQTSGTAVMLWRRLPASPYRARFRLRSVRDIWRFAAGMSATTIVTVVLLQSDKIILSRLLPLEAVGYYALASVAANGLHYLIGPLFAAIFPHLSQLASLGDAARLKASYLQYSQLAAVMIIPIAVVLALFAPEVLFVWTRDVATVEKAWVLLTVLVIGTAMNGLVHLPYALQLAHGWTSLGFYTNLVGAVVLVPSMYVMVLHFGAVGGAIPWLLLNAGYMLAYVIIMHRRILPGEQWEWYSKGVAVPLAGAVLVAGLWRLAIFDLSPSWWRTAALLATVYAMTLVATTLITPWTRQWITGQIRGGSRRLRRRARELPQIGIESPNRLP